MPTTVSQYLATRLKALGLKHIFHVPGNYTAQFLLDAHEPGTLECVGTTNELEAGYAADAYARLQGIGACCVTYGVGSQSLYNAIAGAYVEFCPVVLINGGPTAQKAAELVARGVLFAHAIDPIRTDELIFRPVTEATTVLTNATNAPAEIDRVLRACIAMRRPVYIEVRQDVWGQQCEDPSNPDQPLTPLPLSRTEEEGIVRVTEAAVADVLARVKQAKHPVIWGGEMLQRLGLQEAFADLLTKAGVPYTTTLMAKGLVPETKYASQFLGVYDSKFAPDEVRTVVEGADCLLALGTILSDFYGDIVQKAYDRMILVAGKAVRVGHYTYPHVPLDRFVHLLMERWDQSPSHRPPEGAQDLIASRARSARKEVPIKSDQRPSQAAASGARALEEKQLVTWEAFFARLPGFLKPDMVLLVDTSLALFPSAEIPIGEGVRFLAQTAWLSIGYTVGASLGVSMSRTKAVPVAIVGDGGFQMIPQAFSTLVHNRKPAVLFVLDNQIYGIEQYLVDQQILPPTTRFFGNEDTDPSFFDVLPKWDYVKLAEAFGGKGYLVTNEDELDHVLQGIGQVEGPTLVAVRLEPRSLPAEIAKTLRTSHPQTRAFAEAATSPLMSRPVNIEAFD